MKNTLLGALKPIAIHSVPRSGSSWLASILDSSEHVAMRFQPLFSYTHKSQLTEESTSEEIESFFKDILNTRDEFVLQKSEDRRIVAPTFEKKKITHLVYKEVRYHYILENLINKNSKMKVIGLIRNPLSTIASWYKAGKEFRKDLGWKIEDEWRFAPKKNVNRPEEYYGYEKWKETAFIFNKLKEQFPSQFYLIEYDELLHNSKSVVTSLFDFLDLKYSSQTSTFLQESQMKSIDHDYSVYKIKRDDTDWKNVLPNAIVQNIRKDLNESELAKYLD